MIEISLPQIGESAESVKDRVITILSEEYPLTTMQLYLKIKRNYNLSVTYQAVRKAIESLMDKKILEREEKSYKINKQWIFETKSFFDSLLLKYEEGRKFLKISPEFNKDNYSIYTFNTLLDLDNFWGDIMLYWADHIKSEEPREFIAVGHYSWWMLINFGRETKIFEYYNKKKIKSSFILWKNNCLNKWAIKIYKNLKLKCSISENKQEDEHSSINVMGDTIIQVQYDKKIIEKLRRFFEQNKSIQEAKIEEITKLAHAPCEIKFILYKNKSLAKTLRESYKKHLK